MKQLAPKVLSSEQIRVELDPAVILVDEIRGVVSINIGPFQYAPLQQLEHPVQPDDDLSVKDPTIKTVDRSRISYSPHLRPSVQASAKSIDNQLVPNDKESFLDEMQSPWLIAFTQKSQETTKKEAKERLLSPKYLQSWMKHLRMGNNVNRFLQLFDLGQIAVKSQTIILPQSVIGRLWIILFYITIATIFIYKPLAISFDSQSIPISIVFVAMYVCNIIIQLCSAYAINGYIITSRKAILNRYLRNYCTIDIISIIILIMLAAIDSSYIVELWIMLIILVIINLNRWFMLEQEIQFQFNLFKQYFAIGLVVLKLFLLMHIFACIWHSILQNGEQSSWGSKLEFWDESDIYSRYALSIFWVITSLSANTILSPQNQLEAAFSSLLTFMSIFIVSYVIVNLSQWFKDDQLIVQLSQFLHENRIEAGLKHQIRSHIMDQPKHQQQFISKLSQPLKKEFNIWQRSKVLSSYFKDYSSTTITQLTSCCEDIIYHPNQMVIKEQDVDDQSIYFILEGQFNIVTKTGKLLMELGINQTFGEISFYTQQPRQATIVSDGVSRVLKLKRQLFLTNLTMLDKQYFHQTKDNILFQSQYPIQCYCCKSNRHLILNCPQLVYKPDIERVIKQQIYPTKQIRQPFNRTKDRNNKAILYVRDFEQYADEYVQLFTEYQLNPSNVQSDSQIPYDDALIRDSYTSARSLSKVSRDRSVLKSTSLLKQQSIYDQTSLPNNDNIFFNAEDHEFSNLGDGNEQNDDEFISLVRNNGPKRTFATAGFGHQSVGEKSLKEATNKSLNIIMEKESSEYNSQSNENIDETPPMLDKSQLRAPITRKHDPRLTFNNNFDFQMNERHSYKQFSRNGSGSIRQNSQRQSTLKPDSVRQNSIRSLTYTPLGTHSNQNATLQNLSYRSILNQINSSQQAKGRKSTNSIISSKSQFGQPPQTSSSQQQQQQMIDSPDVRSTMSKRQTQRKRSTKTGTRVSMAPSSFQPFSNVDNPMYGNTTYDITNFETMQQYEVFFRHNNYQYSIIMANACKTSKILKHLSLYSMSYAFAARMQKLKLKYSNCQKQQGNKPERPPNN